MPKQQQDPPECASPHLCSGSTHLNSIKVFNNECILILDDLSMSVSLVCLDGVSARSAVKYSPGLCHGWKMCLTVGRFSKQQYNPEIQRCERAASLLKKKKATKSGNKI